jgi:hypothetical protein
VPGRYTELCFVHVELGGPWWLEEIQEGEICNSEGLSSQGLKHQAPS